MAFYISNLPRPAGDRQGPLAALRQQLLMSVMPPLLRLSESTVAPAESERDQ
jgi:thiosulfate dehydrogenase